MSPLLVLRAERDLTSSPALSPLKGFYTVDGSAHSPLLEEPERALDFLLEDVNQRKSYSRRPSVILFGAEAGTG